MHTSDPLQALAAWCGIAPDYDDIWGNRHPTSEATCLALLRAMHLPVDSQEPAAILQRLEDETWRRGLPPVRVAREGEPITVLVSLPAAEAARVQGWRLTLETGEVREGEFVPKQQPRVGKREIGKRKYLRCHLELPPLDLAGYHRLELAPPGQEGHGAMSLIVTPTTCYQPAAVQGEGRVWGPAVQLYGVRSRRNWGIGDFTDLRNLVEMTAEVGGGIVGVNPLHALFPDDPGRCNPYSPSSRRFLNVLYIDVEALPEFRECEAAQELAGSERFQARLRGLRAEELVNYGGVAAAKREVLELLYRHFRERHLGTSSERGQVFRRFCEQEGEALEWQARFEALHAHFHAQDESVGGFQDWPAPYRDSNSPEVAAFVAANREAVAFYAWLQWLADSQLAEVGRCSWQRGLGVGLYQDLAVGVNPGGAEAWRWQGVLAAGAGAGAPPDEFALQGQDWGLPPFIPHRLREAAYAPLIDVLRSTMRHAGALRIDHAMALMRLFWVPAGLGAVAGAYVSYPCEDLLGVVALESRRNRCLMIGEDLGTVPGGFRPRLAETGILSYRVFLFERGEDGGFTPPAEYLRQALVTLSTHDLPTLAGLWKGTDLDTRAGLGLIPSDAQREALVVARSQDRARLLMALEREQLLPEGASVHPVSVPELTQPFVTAIHAYLARTPSQVLLVQPEDILGQLEQVHLPGSGSEQHPNWRRRLTLDLEEWRLDGRFSEMGEALRRERGTSVHPPQEATAAPRVAVIPRATYRLQFNRDFTFAQATELVPYLAELGISHCYASPYLKARPGSGHGYDIVDHTALNPEIGTPKEYDAFVAALHAHGMGQILDVVPNHMGVMGADNGWWLDVLENGPASTYGRFFDIDWNPLNPDLKGKVLLPLLGDHYGIVLNQGELQLRFDAGRGELSLFYWQHRLPIDPASYPRILEHRSERLAAALGESHPRLVELYSLLTALSHLPERCESDPVRQMERQRDKEVHKRQLAALCAASADITLHIEENLRELNGRPGDPCSFDSLHELIQLQGYRLAYWRVASDEINYRRFFDINDLAALRMEEPVVFEATHRLILDLVAQGKVDGLRVDHPDGLFDPLEYFQRLQKGAGGKALVPGEPLPLYLVIEKILAEHERLPDDWPIHGATGYRFANLVTGLFVDGAAERRMTRIYEDFIGERVNFEEMVHESKRLIMDTALAGELNVLANLLARIAAMSRDTCDFTLNNLRVVLAEVAACFPVYRSYVSAQGVSAEDRKQIEWAVAVARRHCPAADVSTFDFVKGVLTSDIAQGRPESYGAAVANFAMKFQQFTSPVMAKGLEDTAFYRYHRLVSLNDVGGDPRRFGVSVAAFHGANRSRAPRWPHNMLATSTHDSKRAEDVRARLNLLSELPSAWKLMLQRWTRINRGRRREIDGQPAPSANDEYLLYQTLVGVWPPGDPLAVDLEAFRQRIDGYMIKAVREAKEHSSWVKVNGDYEAALSAFIAALLTPGEKNLFLAEFLPAVQRIIRHGLVNGLAQALLKLTLPGVPDIYQGCELWQFHLVDPDNRNPVDFEERRRLLEAVRGDFEVPPAQWPERLQPLVDGIADGRLKLYLTWRALNLRGRWPELFRQGEYLPLNVKGEQSAHLVAFARIREGRAILVLVPRLTFDLSGERDQLPMGDAVWGDTSIELPERLASRNWLHWLTGRESPGGDLLSAAYLLRDLPVALLLTQEGLNGE